MRCWILLGQSLLALGRIDDARQALERALELAEAQRHDGPADDVRRLLAGLR
jgi:cytochrome c-type biogenesis protein CcmH/NrfG